MDKDVYFIKRTFELAKKAQGFTSPNPLVGAVIVKGGKVIAQGYHKKCGLPHAEIEAIKKAKGISLKGASLYVNLEPCFHYGRTPPCVDKIIERGFSRVVAACVDPNPLVKGKSIKKLRQAGIEVNIGVCRSEGEKLNEVFFKNMRARMPFIAVKTAQSLDGKTAAKTGISKWITSSKSRDFAKSLRDKYDAVLVGIKTVIKDNPGLNGLKKKSFKVIIDPSLKIPLNSNILKDTSEKVIVFSSFSAKKKEEILSRLGVKVFFMKEAGGRLPLKEILKKLYELGVRSVFVEGGAETIGGFFDQGVVDKVYFFIAPKIIGGRKALTSVGAEGFGSPNKCCKIEDINISRVGEDFLITGYPNFSG